jgi:hypothetical protein
VGRCPCPDPARELELRARFVVQEGEELAKRGVRLLDEKNVSRSLDLDETGARNPFAKEPTVLGRYD